MIKATKEGKIDWTVEVQTTETNDAAKKPVEEEDDIKWTVDECYVSFYCKYQGNEFLMITYEMIKNAEKEHKVSTMNMVFLPPLTVRLFNLHTLMPYSVEASAVLLEQIHKLWELLLEMYKAKSEHVALDVTAGALEIED
ncbi:MAG: hypothetical protein NC489_43870 [Ruminococcus flavefaciens]|nr:hypothetical protein [Ruminococcus flavefaciens]